ncbi:MAG TPA: GntR family transcriptional regulator [Holophaga sp.]|nr:GntR family transcriptional regulator [Holophaga sp.]
MKSSAHIITKDVLARLRSMILASELKPGQRLVEEDLCRTLGAGRTPVREALLLLQGEGYVLRERGWEVQGAGRLDLHTIFESRVAVEAATARLAARKITPESCVRMEELLARMAPGPSLKRAALNALNNEFHQIIIRTADNPLLTQLHERTMFHYWALRLPIMFSDEELKRVEAQHQAILEALRKGDEDAAERCARAHAEMTRDIVESAIQP